MRYKKSRLELLMRHVEKTDTCWLWTGARVGRKHGAIYGAVFIETYGEHLAHRAVWVHSGLKLEKDDCLLHSCDIPHCVNPSHLWVGTQRDNINDMMQKGRWLSGKRLAKLTTTTNIQT